MTTSMATAKCTILLKIENTWGGRLPFLSHFERIITAVVGLRKCPSSWTHYGIYLKTIICIIFVNEKSYQITIKVIILKNKAHFHLELNKCLWKCGNRWAAKSLLPTNETIFTTWQSSSGKRNDEIWPALEETPPAVHPPELGFPKHPSPKTTESRTWFASLHTPSEMITDSTGERTVSSISFRQAANNWLDWAFWKPVYAMRTWRSAFRPPLPAHDIPAGYMEAVRCAWNR